MDEQVRFYAAKLKFETDAWDLFELLNGPDSVVVIDTRSEEAYPVCVQKRPSMGVSSTGLGNRVFRLPADLLARMANKSASPWFPPFPDGNYPREHIPGALQLARLGFAVRELIGGLDWWKRDGYATEGTQGRAGKTLACGC